ncbi:glycosyltransferase family 2 protein [Halapricum hydrolyticum]|uniref:Glycosyltransferase family 2 protein n=1 Tax=Halapricum hydrolyticum TaxID=2979991 RepID=A0AAE3IAX8_9EURY|nr:glycosyltransferase family 2 protein [Halapricum hydrolyticum]MCU4717695.1 glycosyltransferase family 2 protein [Halapricum hydrolyticum]MCU4726776.1 glycosyltransferase family 2 protein [Halapricum hydrolyticum]
MATQSTRTATDNDTPSDDRDTARPMHDRDTELSVLAIVPAYNEAGTIADVVAETSRYVDKVVVIDDASTDGTESRAREVADGVVSHPRNMGVGGAVHTGYLVGVREEFDVVVQIDGDGQHDPADIPRLLERIADGADMVIGSRFLNDSYREYSLVRRAGIRFFTWEVNALAGLDITDVTSGFRAYTTALLADLSRPENSHWALEQTLEASRKGYRIVEVSTPMPPETDGSQFDLGTFLKYPPRMIKTTMKVLLFR